MRKHRHGASEGQPKKEIQRNFMCKGLETREISKKL